MNQLYIQQYIDTKGGVYATTNIQQPTISVIMK